MRTHPARAAHADQSTLARWATAMAAEGKAPRTTIYDRVRIVRAFLDYTAVPIERVSAADIRYWLARYPNRNTLCTYDKALRSVCAFMLAEGIRPDDPMAAMRRPLPPKGTPRVPSQLALHRLVSWPGLPGRTRAFITLGAFQGLRASETARVHGHDLDLGEGTLAVLGKGSVRAVLPLHPCVVELAALMPANDYWFPSPARPGHPISPCIVMTAMREACAEVGVHIVSHQLRHWYGSTLVRQGADLRTVQELLRHASLNTTQIYTQVTDESRRAAVLRLPTLGGGA